MVEKDATNPPPPPPWHEAFAEPRNKKPGSIHRPDLLRMFREGKIAGKDFLLVDLRRNDHEGGTIRGSINLPAQSLYYSLPVLYNLCETAGIETVIWYCGSSQGRGPRAAGWFDDVVKDRGNTNIKSLILEGGIKGWATSGKAHVEYMDGYDENVWRRGSE